MGPNQLLLKGGSGTLLGSLGRGGLEFDMGMHGLGDLVAGFDEGGGTVSGAGGQQGFAVIENFLRQSPVAHHDVEFGESDTQQFAQVAAGRQSARWY